MALISSLIADGESGLRLNADSDQKLSLGSLVPDACLWLDKPSLQVYMYITPNKRGH